jgi:DNA primase large subunit
MDQRGLEFLAKYPFLRQSRQYVGALRMSLEDILRHPVYSGALQLGRNRVIDCVGGRFKPNLSDAVSAELTVLSYPIARMLAKGVGTHTALKYAEGEADAAYAFLKDEDENTTAEIVSDLGLIVEDQKMRVTEYVRLAASQSRKNPRWKLVNHTVSNGKVDIGPGEVRVLLREAVKNRVLEPIDGKRIPEEIRRASLDLKVALMGETPTMAVEALEPDAVPPCMKAMIAALEAGIASHNSMFILASFLTNLGLRKEETLKVFSRSPKYDEEKTLYQLDFITGERGATEYTCPACATIKSHGLCKADCPVKHPLQFYRQHARHRPVLIKKENK